MRIFLDTNVLIDILQAERESHDYSTAILQAVRVSPLTAGISTQSVVDASYVFTQGSKAPVSAFKKVIDLLGSIVDILSIEREDIEAANFGAINDYEDAVQVACALRNGCDAIITNDHKFQNYSQITCYTPKEFYVHLFGTTL